MPQVNQKQAVDALADRVADEFNDQSVKINANTSKLSKMMPDPADSLQNLPLAIFGNSIIKKSGYLANDETATFGDGKVAGNAVSYLSRDGDFTLQTSATETAIGDGELGSLELVLNGNVIDTFDLAGNFDANEGTGNQSYPPATGAANKLKVVSVGVYNTFYQKAVVQMMLSPSDLLHGYNELVLKHTDINADQTSQKFQLWFDNSTLVPTLSALNMTLESHNASTLSGVVRAGSGSKINLSVAVSGAISSCYDSTPLNISGMRCINNSVIAVSDGAVSGLSNPPVADEEMTVTNKELTLLRSGQCTKDLRASMKANNPFVSSSAALTPSIALMASTLTTASSDTVENFNNEAYRLPADYDFSTESAKTDSMTGHWDSSQLLSDGDAQVGIVSDNVQGLFLAREDFTGKLPANTADYSSFTKDGVFKRFFESPGARGNCQIILHGVTANSIQPKGTGAINVSIEVPTQTGSLDCAVNENTQVAATEDGAGCLDGVISYSGGKATLTASFKGKSTFSSNNRIGFDIKLRDLSQKPTKIECIWT